MPEEKSQQAWKKFQEKMASLRKKRSEILVRISEKLDQQHIAKLRKKLHTDE
jgi:predicted nucleotide-binding protein (sugar kinase/HSP70/actin superfamily)